MEGRPPGLYIYMMMIFGMIVLAYSLWVLYSAIASYQHGQMENFYYGIIASSVGMILAAMSLMSMRKRLAIFAAMSTRVLTVVLCPKCGFKVVRSFSVGDYVHREVGKCQQCEGLMRITSIYAEEMKKRSF